MNDEQIRRTLVEHSQRAPSYPGLLEDLRIGIHRRARSRRLVSVTGAAAIVATLVVAAPQLSQRDRSSDLGAPTTGRLLPLPTSGWDPSDPDAGRHFAAVIGVLRGDSSIDGGCVWLDGGADGPRPVLWPKGYQVRFHPEVQVMDPDGRIVARAGDRIGFGGQGAGQVPSGTRCMFGKASAAHVESAVTVIPAGAPPGEAAIKMEGAIGSPCAGAAASCASYLVPFELLPNVSGGG